MTTKSKMPAGTLPGIGSLNDIARSYIAAQQSPDDIYRAKWTTAKREAYFKSNPENFGDPENQGYPIEDASDVNDAARLAGHASNPDAVRKRIIEIAKRLGFSNALPDSWKEDMKDKNKTAERSDQADELAGNTTPEQTSDPSDSNEQRSTSEPTIERSMPAPDVTYYAPITRIDREKREVIGTATAEIKDAYRTVIGYEASKDAFARWQGNIREMHQSKAVGRALEITPDDEHRRIIVRARISKGAEDTWQKILDGTLTGFSIGGKNGVWTKRVIGGEELPYLERYDQFELSVVDNPACPSATFEVVRADGVAGAILATDEEIDAASAQRNAPNIGGDSRNPTGVAAEVQRAGARLSKDTQAALHTARDHSLNAAKQTMQTCGCDDCMDAMNKFAENDDGDGDADAPDMRKIVADIVRSELSAFTAALQNQNAATMQRVNALLAADASRTENPDITRRVDDMHVQLDAIKELCEKIAAQPVDGGPVLHGAAVEKRLATQHGGDASRSTDADAIQRAMELGFAPPSDPNDAIRAAAKLIRPIPR